MNPHELFQKEVEDNIKGLSRDESLKALSRAWMKDIAPHKWVYNFSWLGRPAIQFPNDAWQMQELIWKIKPDLIIETGIAHGGSLIFYASMLALLDLCEAAEEGTVVDPRASKRHVLGIDIDIRAHNRAAIEKHPMSPRIKMIQGSSIDPDIVDQTHAVAKNYQTIMVCLDSNHAHDHVLAELKAYTPLVSVESYCVVFDTIVEDMPKELCVNRPWSPGNSPKTAVFEFLKENKQFEIDTAIHNKLQITVAPEGYLKRIR